MSILWPAAVVVPGFVIDLFCGDPRWLYHPVRIIGNLITVSEKGLRSIFPKTKQGERAAGTLLVLLVVFLSTAVPLALLVLLYRLLPPAGVALEVFWCYQLLAVKSLRTESDAVYRKLNGGTLDGARRAVSMIVGRDTRQLDEAGITRAAVETVAENTSDGVVAPLFFMMVGGAVGGFFYKAINTMDSMVGYKNEKYAFFGTAAAKLDDLVNFLPARMAALLMILAAALAGEDAKNARRIWKRDRRKHASPNSAQTESVMAGALHIRLAGDAWYFGQLHQKPYIGDDDRPVRPEDIRRSHRLLYGTAWLSLALFAAVRLFLGVLFCDIF